MNFLKSLFRFQRSRIWAIVSLVMAGLMLLITVLTATVLYDMACMQFGEKRIVGRDGSSNYPAVAANKQESYLLGNDLNEQICEEGFVLLKNALCDDGKAALPLAAGAKISVFGKNSVNLVYGGTGSGGGNFKNVPTLFDSLEEAGFRCNPVLRAFYDDSAKSGGGRTSNPKIENSGKEILETGETPQNKYTKEVRDSYAEYADAALIVFSRIGGEGFDLPRTTAGEGHYLELDENERALLGAVTEANFGRVVVIINASTTIEAGEIRDNAGVDACISMGGPGFSGIAALGKILNGSVDPSGRTVDTWAADFTEDPTWRGAAMPMANGADGAAYVSAGSETGYYFSDYAEGIYVGYRYYETRGTTDGEAWYASHVVWPFGYGLSYTTFGWSVGEAAYTLSQQSSKSALSVEVTVSNTGTCAGKDVVQLWCVLPESEIERPSSVLCAFAKTDLLYPAAEAGEGRPNSQTVTLTFEPYYLASFDAADANGNGFAGFELERGDYALRLCTDAHTQKEGTAALHLTVAEDVRYENDPVTGTAVTSLFADADDELATVLSRKDWEGTMPTAAATRELSDETRTLLADTKPNAPAAEEEMPVTGADVPFNAAALRGLDYHDPQWERLLDCLTFTELKDLFNRGAFKTVGIAKINLPQTVASDGPVGFVNFVSDANISSGNVSYASQYVLGCTWSVELAREMGRSVGEEGIYGDGERIPTPYTGWYAPGVNLHRSPFGGRNFEYFSEDPYLTGQMAAAEIEGAQSRGVVPFMKHFALNDMETHRDDNGVATWATEQAIRELYLRPFEIAVKAGAHGVMSSFNRIGTRWTGGDYRLLTQVLREEWGFVGCVICDFNVSAYMSTKQMIYAGGDLNLTVSRYWMRPDETSAADVSALRRAAHNILYVVVNSNAMDGIDEHTVLREAIPLWQEILYLCEAAIFLGLCIWGGFEIAVLRKTLKRRADGDDDRTVRERSQT